jgi:hypothetical protein
MLSDPNATFLKDLSTLPSACRMPVPELYLPRGSVQLAILRYGRRLRTIDRRRWERSQWMEEEIDDLLE